VQEQPLGAPGTEELCPKPCIALGDMRAIGAPHQADAITLDGADRALTVLCHINSS
jgi:hypothetical protein